jgi:hypothetical protein
MCAARALHVCVPLSRADKSASMEKQRGSVAESVGFLGFTCKSLDEPSQDSKPTVPVW